MKTTRKIVTAIINIPVAIMLHLLSTKSGWYAVDNKNALLLEQWKMAAEQARYEGNLTWQKFYYFLGANVLLFTAVGALWSTLNETRPIIKVICFVGAAISTVWVITQERGRSYHAYWIKSAKATEDKMLVHGEKVINLFDRDLNNQALEKLSFIGKLRTQTFIVLLGIGFAVGWIIALLYFSQIFCFCIPTP